MTYPNAPTVVLACGALAISFAPVFAAFALKPEYGGFGPAAIGFYRVFFALPLLWLVLLSCVVKGIFVTYFLGRYTAVSGEYIGHRLVRLPGPRGWLLLAIVAMEMIGAPLAWVPIAKPCGDLFHYLLRDLLPNAAAETVWEKGITCLFIALA